MDNALNRLLLLQSLVIVNIDPSSSKRDSHTSEVYLSFFLTKVLLVCFICLKFWKKLLVLLESDPFLASSTSSISKTKELTNRISCLDLSPRYRSNLTESTFFEPHLQETPRKACRRRSAGANSMLSFLFSLSPYLFSSYYVCFKIV